MRLPPPRATVALVTGTVVAWGIVASAGLDAQAAMRAGFIPARWTGMGLEGALPAALTPLSATLVHAGLLHLAFNMLMLGFCGRFVEASVRIRGVMVLYVAGAYAAAAAQWLATPFSMNPMVGASGAISAIVAAYALLYGERRSRIRTRWLAEIVHTVWLAAAWIVLQLMVGLLTAGTERPIAIYAHVGGFLAGLILARPLLRWSFRGRAGSLR